MILEEARVGVLPRLEVPNEDPLKKRDDETLDQYEARMRELALQLLQMTRISFLKARRKKNQDNQ